MDAQTWIFWKTAQLELWEWGWGAMRTLLAYPRPCPSSDSQIQAGLPQLFPLPVTTVRVCPEL